MDHSVIDPVLARVPFRIGLAPIEPAALLQIDSERDAQLALKRRHHAEEPDEIYAVETGPWAATAEAEAAALIDAALGARGLALADAPDAPPLLRAAFSVQEDLAVMGRDGPDDPFRLIAGAVCFPSSWSLRINLGRPPSMLHASVPDFGPGSRNASVIDRVFAALQPGQPMERYGWSIYPDAVLRQPAPKSAREEAAWCASILADPHLRVERQTLTKLPRTGAILFTVRIHLAAFTTLERSAQRAEALADRLEILSDAATEYKGLESARPALIARLRAAAAR